MTVWSQLQRAGLETEGSALDRRCRESERGRLWESPGRDQCGGAVGTCKGLADSSDFPLPPSPPGENGLDSLTQNQHHPPPRPQAGGITLPQGCPRASGSVWRSDQQR